jgi:hypothetical protein
MAAQGANLQNYNNELVKCKSSIIMNMAPKSLSSPLLPPSLLLYPTFKRDLRSQWLQHRLSTMSALDTWDRIECIGKGAVYYY